MSGKLQFMNGREAMDVHQAGQGEFEAALLALKRPAVSWLLRVPGDGGSPLRRVERLVIAALEMNEEMSAQERHEVALSAAATREGILGRPCCAGERGSQP